MHAADSKIAPTVERSVGIIFGFVKRLAFKTLIGHETRKFRLVLGNYVVLMFI